MGNQPYSDLSIKSSQDKSLDITDDTDEDLEDLPSQEESSPRQTSAEPDQASSLSTIREGSPVNSIEEWSPSPADDDKLSGCSSSNIIPATDNRHSALNEHIKTRSLPKGFVHNYLSKMKNMMKK